MSIDIGWLIGFGIVLIVLGFFAVDYFLLNRGVDFAGRAKRFFLGLICSIISILFGLGFYFEISDLLEITLDGKEVVGEVRESKTETRFRRGRTRVSHKNTVSYNLFKKTFDLDKPYPIGTQFYIVYSKKNPNIARISKLRQSFFSYFLSQHTWWGIIVFIAGPIFAGLMGIRFFYIAFSSKKVFESIEE